MKGNRIYLLLPVSSDKQADAGHGRAKNNRPAALIIVCGKRVKGLFSPGTTNVASVRLVAADQSAIVVDDHSVGLVGRVVAATASIIIVLRRRPMINTR
ncbi:MAG: hypothetical protein LBL33_10655 [Tannerella sp.]|nr:hypothetical protein [Tannerella sp.]